METYATAQELGELHADVAACLLAIKVALDKKGVLSHDEFVEAFQERLLTLQGAPGGPKAPYRLLSMVAAGDFPRRPED